MYLKLRSLLKLQPKKKESSSYNPPKILFKPSKGRIYSWQRTVDEFWKAPEVTPVYRVTKEERNQLRHDQQLHDAHRRALVVHQRYLRKEARRPFDELIARKYAVRTALRRRKFLRKEEMLRRGRIEFLKVMSDSLHRWIYSPDELAFARYRIDSRNDLKGTKLKKWIDKGRTPLTLIKSTFSNKMFLKFSNTNELPPFDTLPFTEQESLEETSPMIQHLEALYLQGKEDQHYEGSPEPWKNINLENKWEKLALTLSSIEGNVFKNDQKGGEWGMQQFRMLDENTWGHQMQKKMLED